MRSRAEQARAADQLRGATKLALDGTARIVDLVEAMHLEIGGGPRVLGRPLLAATRLFSSPVYMTLRGVTALVGAGLDLALVMFAQLRGNAGAGAEIDSAVAVLNGVIGDYLADTDNPLAIAMTLRHGGEALELHTAALRRSFPHAKDKLLVLVHGSCRHDRQWMTRGHDHVGALALELGYTPVYLRYNTGLHIATNGRLFATMLERLVAAWPVEVAEVALIGHSMGGLVARSAAHTGEVENHAWRGKLRDLVCIASPHHGAPLERAGNWVDVLLGVSRYSAPLARLGMIRSAGVTDMRFGNVLDEHLDPRGRFARGRDVRGELRLPAGVRCYAVAATCTARPGAERYASDGLVPVESALGRHRNPKLTLTFEDTWIGFGMGHVEVLARPELYAVIRSWLCRGKQTERDTGAPPERRPVTS